MRNAAEPREAVEAEEAESNEAAPMCVATTCTNVVWEEGTHCTACAGELFGGDA